MSPTGKDAAVMKVLVVDDSEVIRQRLMALVAPLDGVSIVAQTDSVETASTLAKELRPEVVTLDLSLADGSGLSLLEEVKGWEDPPVVIVLTNFPYPAFRTRSLELGADFFFTKSRDFHRVEEILLNLESGDGFPSEGEAAESEDHI